MAERHKYRKKPVCFVTAVQLDLETDGFAYVSLSGVGFLARREDAPVLGDANPAHSPERRRDSLRAELQRVELGDLLRDVSARLSSFHRSRRRGARCSEHSRYDPGSGRAADAIVAALENREPVSEDVARYEERVAARGVKEHGRCFQCSPWQQGPRRSPMLLRLSSRSEHLDEEVLA
jgi:hypothetical protein